MQISLLGPANVDPNLSRNGALVRRGNTSHTATPGPSNSKGQLLLTASSQSVPPNPSTEQEQMMSKTDLNNSKPKNMSSLTGSQAKRRRDK